MTRSASFVSAAVAVALLLGLGACAGARNKRGGADIAGGERFFQAKCNRCHPGGKQGAGPPIDPAIAPSFLKKNGSGRHGVPGAEWNGLLAYMNKSFAPAVAAAPAVPPAAPPPVPAAALPPPVAPVPAPAGDDNLVGQQVFQARCHKCHPNAHAGVAPDLVGKPLPGPLVVSDVPGRHNVPAAEMSPLLSFVVSRGGGASATAFVLPTAGGGDVRAGSTFYASSCNKCHPGGQAGVAPALVGKRLPGPLFVSAAPDGRHGVSAADWENLNAFLVTLGAVR